RRVVADLPVHVVPPASDVAVQEGTGVVAARGDLLDAAGEDRGGGRMVGPGAIAQLAEEVVTPAPRAAVEDRAAVLLTCRERRDPAGQRRGLHRRHAGREGIVPQLP